MKSSMKKYFWMLCVALMGAVTLTSCKDSDDDDDSDWITDWAPVELLFIVEDQSGNPWPTEQGIGALGDMKVEFDGKEYPLRFRWIEKGFPFCSTEYDEGGASRMLMPKPFGLQLFRSKWLDFVHSYPEYIFYWGQIDGAKDYDEDIVLTLPNGQVHNIHYHCSDHTSGKFADCVRWFEYNGVRQNNSQIKIVMK